MKKTPLLISVVGQTATGKTNFSLKLAELLLTADYKKILLLSADSKQVFQGLETLTGADIPENFQTAEQNQTSHRFFRNPSGSIELHGIACVNGKEEWSVAHFQKLFKALVRNSKPQTALIVVGGTGLYHQQIFNPGETIAIKPDLALRKKLETYSLDKLQQTLQKTWFTRWKKMNHSDRQNPRRLVRAIEVASISTDNQLTINLQPTHQFGLRLPLKVLQTKISERVDQRIEQSVMAEVQQFELHQPEINLQAKASLGYQEILKYLRGELSLEALKKAWILAEIQYAKRQQTWWKKQPNITWFEADNIDFASLKSYNF